MRGRYPLSIVATAIAVLAVACTEDPPTAPTPPDQEAWCLAEGRLIPESQWSQARCVPADMAWCEAERREIPTAEWNSDRCVAAEPAPEATPVAVAVANEWPVFRVVTLDGVDYDVANWEYLVDGVQYGEAPPDQRGYQPAGRRAIRANVTSSMREHGATIRAEYCAGDECDHAPHTLEPEPEPPSPPPPEPNRAPEIHSFTATPTSVMNSADGTVTLRVVASDQDVDDRDRLEYVWEADVGEDPVPPRRLSEPHVAEWVIPASTPTGRYCAIVEVSDPHAAADTADVCVEVTAPEPEPPPPPPPPSPPPPEPNRAPEIHSFTATPTSVMNSADGTVTLRVVASDQDVDDRDRLEYVWEADVGEDPVPPRRLSEPHVAEWVIPASTPTGRYCAIVEVSDPHAAADTADVCVEVTD